MLKGSILTAYAWKEEKYNYYSIAEKLFIVTLVDSYKHELYVK